MRKPTKILTTILYVLSFIVSSLLLAECKSKSSTDNQLESIDNLCSYYLQNARYHEMDSLARVLESEAEKLDSKRYLSKAWFYLGNFIEGEDSATMDKRRSRLDMAEKIAETECETDLLCQIYNAKGIWELENRNYLTAQYYFKRGTHIDRDNGDEKALYSLESNFSEVSRLLEDTLGMRYDREIFEHSLKTGNFLLQRAAAFHCTRYYMKPNGDTLALKEYLDIMAVNDTDSRLVPMVYARYWLANEDYGKAYEYIRQSKFNKSHEAAFTYARILNRLKKYEESNEYVEALLEIYGEAHPGHQWISLHKLQADNYYGLGKYSDAYESMSIYANASDSLRTHNLADLSKRHMIEFGTEKLSLTVRNQTDRIRFLWILAVALSIIIITIVGGSIFYYRKRNKLYRSIVEQYMESKERESNLTIQVELLNKKYSHSTPPTDPAEDRKGTTLKNIWSDIQNRMEHDILWKNPQLSRDSLASMIGCSHTYLTEAIRKETGMSFPDYINTIRIEEAKKLLTDLNTNGDLTLKEISERVGFSSLSNFYTLFKAKCGMTPAAFRKTARIVADSE